MINTAAYGACILEAQACKCLIKTVFEVYPGNRDKRKSIFNNNWESNLYIAEDYDAKTMRREEVHVSSIRWCNHRDRYGKE